MLVLLLVVLLVPTAAHAAITCTGESFVFGTPTDPQNQNYTVPSVTNGVTFIGVTTRSGARTISSVTIGGNAVTQIGAKESTANVATSVYYRVAVASGTQSISVNFDAAPLTYVLTAVTCGGVNQTTPVASSASANGTGTAVSVACTGTTSSQKVLDFPASNGAPGSFTPGSGQTVFDQDAVESLLAGVSEETGGGTITMSHTAPSADWATICAVINSSDVRPLGRAIFFQ